MVVKTTNVNPVVNHFMTEQDWRHTSIGFMKDTKITIAIHVENRFLTVTQWKYISELYMKARKITIVNLVTNILLNHRASKDILILFMVIRNRKRKMNNKFTFCNRILSVCICTKNIFDKIIVWNELVRWNRLLLLEEFFWISVW